MAAGPWLAVSDHPWRALLLVAGLVLGAAAVAASCGDDEPQEGELPVAAEVVSHQTTQEILVVTPDVDGTWPVVWLMHGIGGTSADMTDFAARLAAQGLVVFAPTFSTDLTTEQGALEAVQDAECGYRYARSIAADHGGDLERPMTFVGWSLGASFVLQGGLTERIDPAGAFLDCFTEVPRADVVVAMSGCHYEFQGARFDFDPSAWGNKDADVILVGGEADGVCSLWQSEDAAAALRSVGYDVRLDVLDGADHFAPIFRDLVGDELVPSPDEPAGTEAVDIVVGAVGDR